MSRLVCETKNRERERERERTILAQVLHLCLGVLFHPLVRGTRQRVDLGCAPKGALLSCPVVLEHISAAELLKPKPEPFSFSLLNLNEALLRKVAL